MDIKTNITPIDNIDKYDVLQALVTWGNRAVKTAVVASVVHQGIKNQKIFDTIGYIGYAFFAFDVTDKYIIKPISNAITQKQKLAKLKNGKSKSWDALQKMVGLDDIKQGIEQIKDNALINAIRESQGDKPVYPFMHMQIVGEPGTGKTEAAKLIASSLYELGIMASNKVVLADRSNLVSRFINDSAIKTEAKVLEAKNGCIIIDEAYALDSGNDKKDGGHEAIEKLLVMMEEHKDIVFIFLGYEDKMNVLLDTNKGLSSRIRHKFKVNNYTMEQLMDIFKQHCSRYEYTISAEALEEVKSKLLALKNAEKNNFGNARSAVNLLEKIIITQSSRLAKKLRDTNYREMSREELHEITELDVKNTSVETSQSVDEKNLITMYS
jgi:SpoVK/Ycf46/Vps4 family AAA+-type ATPase